MFVSYRFFNSGSQIRRQMKRQSKLSTTKGLEGGNYHKKCEKLRDTQIPSDLGTPLPQCLFMIVSLIQRSQINCI